MSDTEAPLHPRPQLARDQWVDLRGDWEFCYDDARQGLEQGWQDRPEAFARTIVVPFPPESPASGIGDTHFHPCVWYRRVFSLPEIQASRRVILNFGAVDYRADVWVDGRHAIAHEGGHTPFSADITNSLESGGSHVIVARAEDDPRDLTQPRGKQDWRPEPHAIWYQRTTGIWQPVWIEVTGAAYLSDLRWTPDVPRGALRLDATIVRHDQRELRASVQLRLHDRLFVDDLCLVQGSALHREFSITYESLGLEPQQVLWSPDHPNLIDATVSLLADDAVVDTVRSYAGYRTVDTGSGRFWLNGAPVFLRFALEQGYWPDTHLASPGDSALREEVELARSLGFNGVRIHQKIEDPRYLYWCDRLGLMVWGEMPSAFAFSERIVERQTREWMDALKRDYSHPCIVAWVTLNESWGVPNLRDDAAQRSYVKSLYHLTHALDRTRPVIGNDGWEHVATDIHSIHDYTFHGRILTERYGSKEALEHTLRGALPLHHILLLPDATRTDEPVMITEFGGLSYQPEPGKAWFGYGTVQTKKEYEQKYAELVTAVVDSPVLAGFCYTQLTDTRQETNGLATERRVPKLDAEVVRAITARETSAPAVETEKKRRAAATGSENA